MAVKQDIRDLIKTEFKRMVIEDTFERVTVSELCGRVGISRKTFYSYFNDKFSVLQEIIYDDVLAPIEQTLPIMKSAKTYNTGATSSLLFTERMYQIMLDNKEFYMSIAAAGGARPFARALENASMKLHRTLAELSGGVYGDKMRYACRFGAGAYASVIIEWLRDGMIIPPHELAAWMHDWSFDSSCVGFENDLPNTSQS